MTQKYYHVIINDGIEDYFMSDLTPNQLITAINTICNFDEELVGEPYMYHDAEKNIKFTFCYNNTVLAEGWNWLFDDRDDLYKKGRFLFPYSEYYVKEVNMKYISKQ